MDLILRMEGFKAADIERSLTVNKDGQEVQEWLELANGCICCSVKSVSTHDITLLTLKKCVSDGKVGRVIEIRESTPLNH